MVNIRKPSVAGYFYPGSAKELRIETEKLLEDIRIFKEAEHIYGIISPHAGYIYSGKTAAHAYAQVKGKNYKTVVVIAPSHREYFQGCSIYKGEAYETPLGITELDKTKSGTLCKTAKHLFEGFEGHRGEHSLEVQLPFLQSVLGDFKIIPVVVGDQSKIFLYDLASALTEIIDEETLLVASTDLSHFHNAQDANQLDALVESGIESFDFEKLIKDSATHKLEACGLGPVVVVMKTLWDYGIRKSAVLKRCTSGDASGDYSEVVGYLSALLYR
ncbi:MAG TPA: AmmeMemoRadiSam system protein B [Ignavibacteriaceae bacterium]|nr:AmmeMemoRadiSam system protein B [Ignavibacteriaceae bacterium]HPO56549.1 AmmeMemoRadiSam system protein B [Ignavibacteriaceae bacterium]